MIPVLEDIIRGLLNGTMTHEQAKFYLEQHELLQAEADDDAVGNVPYLRARCLLDVIKKCKEQDDRWGPRQYSSFHPMLVASADTSTIGLAEFHGVTSGRRARLLSAAQDAEGELSWMTILVEEVAKTTEKYEDKAALREQLIDVAGVAIQWASQLTPEPQVSVETVDHGDGTVGLVAHVEADHEGPNLR